MTKVSKVIEQINAPGKSRIDGRTARAVRTRETVVESLLELIEEGDLRPTAPRIAQRAGVSLRSIFQHFPDLDALFAAAAERQIKKYGHLMAPLDIEGPFEERLEKFVAKRCRLYESISPVRRAAVLMEPFSAEIAAWTEIARKADKTELLHIFEPELSAIPYEERRELIEALDATTCWSMWEKLRRCQRLSPTRSTSVMKRMLRALFGRT